jgi:hypothetical protein
MASAPLPKGIQEGIDLFNQRKFHESHDAIEAVWLHEPTGVRLLYQGILQVGISFYFVEKKNWNVALRMFRCCHLKIRHFLPKFQGIELLNLYQKTKKCEKIIKSLGPHRIHEFNFEEIPKISFRLPKG